MLRTRALPVLIGLVSLGCGSAADPATDDGAAAADGGDGGGRGDPGDARVIAAQDAGARSDAASDARSSARDGTVADGARDGGADATRSAADAGSVGTLSDGGEGTGASCGSAAFCEDFEGAAGDGLPSSWTSRAPMCSGDGVAALDDQVAHGGRHSLRVHASGGYCNHAFAVPALASVADPLWVRMFVRFEGAPGSSHSTFLAMHDRVSGKDLRFGVQSGVLIWNRETDDATLPELSPTGISLSVAPSPGVWQCVEFHLDGNAGRLETYVDGQLVEGLVVDGAATMDVDGQWLRPGSWRAQVDDVRFGWESYSDQAMTIWYDDVVIASARPGCEAGG